MKRIRTCGVVGGGAGARFTRFFWRTEDERSRFTLPTEKPDVDT